MIPEDLERKEDEKTGFNFGRTRSLRIWRVVGNSISSLEIPRDGSPTNSDNANDEPDNFTDDEDLIADKDNGNSSALLIYSLDASRILLQIFTCLSCVTTIFAEDFVFDEPPPPQDPELVNQVRNILGLTVEKARWKLAALPIGRQESINAILVGAIANSQAAKPWQEGEIERVHITANKAAKLLLELGAKTDLMDALLRLIMARKSGANLNLMPSPIALLDSLGKPFSKDFFRYVIDRRSKDDLEEATKYLLMWNNDKEFWGNIAKEYLQELSERKLMVNSFIDTLDSTNKTAPEDIIEQK